MLQLVSFNSAAYMSTRPAFMVCHICIVRREPMLQSFHVVSRRLFVRHHRSVHVSKAYAFGCTASFVEHLLFVNRNNSVSMM